MAPVLTLILVESRITCESPADPPGVQVIY